MCESNKKQTKAYEAMMKLSRLASSVPVNHEVVKVVTPKIKASVNRIIQPKIEQNALALMLSEEEARKVRIGLGTSVNNSVNNNEEVQKVKKLGTK